MPVVKQRQIISEMGEKEKGLQQTDWTQIKDTLDFRLYIYKFSLVRLLLESYSQVSIFCLKTIELNIWGHYNIKFSIISIFLPLHFLLSI